MTICSSVNLSVCSRFSVCLKDIVETLTRDAAIVKVDSFEYLRVPVEMILYVLHYI